MWRNAVLSMQKVRTSLDAGKVDVPCFAELDGKISGKGTRRHEHRAAL